MSNLDSFKRGSPLALHRAMRRLLGQLGCRFALGGVLLRARHATCMEQDPPPILLEPNITRFLHGFLDARLEGAGEVGHPGLAGWAATACR